MSVSFYTYPWTIHDADEHIALVKGLGADAITLAVSYHAGKFLQPGDASARVYFPEDGTVYFQPRGDYAALTPRMARTIVERDVLAELTTRGDITVNAWTVLNHNNRLGWAHPEVAARNCFGDVYPYSLCPAHPAVHDYDIALCRDIAVHHDVASLLLETPGWLTYAHGYHHEFAQVPGNAWLDAMLGLCFCLACRTGLADAGIDADGIARRVCKAVDDCLAADELWIAGRQVEQVEGWRRDLADYHDWRASIATGLVADIRSAVRAEVAIKVISTTQRPHATAYLEGHDLATLHAASDGLELPLYQPSVAATADDLDHVLAKTGGPERISVILRPGYPDMTSEMQLDDTIDAVRARGITDIAFYNHGMLRPANLRWLEHSLPRLNTGH